MSETATQKILNGVEDKIPHVEYTEAENRDIAVTARSVAYLMLTVAKEQLDIKSGGQALQRILESGLRTILDVERAGKLGKLYETVADASLDQSHTA